MSDPGLSPPLTTPSRRIPYGFATPSHSTVHTPLDKSAPRDLLNSVRRGQSSVRRTPHYAPTPHARAAQRVMDLRRQAALTPGRGRRKSGVARKETPRDLLRMLSRSLAANSQQVATSSSSPDKKTPGKRGRRESESLMDVSNGMDFDEEEDDDEILGQKPEFTLPLNEDDDDEDLVAPRSMILEDENLGNVTAQSIEYPRRALMENGVDQRLSRMSMGEMRFSDVQLHQLHSDDVAVDSGFFPNIDLDDLPDRTTDLTMQRIDDSTRADLTNGLPDILVTNQEDSFVPLREQSQDSPEPFGDISQLQNLEAPSEEPTQYDVAMAEGDTQMAEGDTAPLPVPNNIDEFPPLQELESEDDFDQGEIKDYPDVILDPEIQEKQREGRKNGKRVSIYGVEYPSLPSTVIKNIALMFAQRSGLGKSKISADTLHQLTLATDWFFEQAAGDLKAYAEHAGRKTIDESDVALLMKRQRQIGPTATLFSQAYKYLPRELLQEVRMPVPPKLKKARAAREEEEEEEEEEEAEEEQRDG